MRRRGHGSGKFAQRCSSARTHVEIRPHWMPYDGVHAEIVPHVTVADRVADQGLLDGIAARVRKRLPLEAQVREAWLMEQGADDIWRRLVTLPFTAR